MGRPSSIARRSVGLVMVVGLFTAACGSTDDVDVSGPDDDATTTTVTTTTGPADTAAPDIDPSTTTTAEPTSTSTTTAVDPSTTTTAPAGGPADECSAAGLTAPPTPAALSAEATATLRAVVDAATVCDYDGLALAAGDEITLSFGGHSEVDTYLEEGDRRDELLRILVGLLAMPPGTIATDVGADISVWPAFWADDEPATAEERAALEAIAGVPYDELVVPDLGYLWYRVGIDADGNWLFFVAGD